jgi:hypothetical protein
VSAARQPVQISSNLFLTENFESRDVKWTPDGKGIVLIDKDVFCCAFEVAEEM